MCGAGADEKGKTRKIGAQKSAEASRNLFPSGGAENAGDEDDAPKKFESIERELAFRETEIISAIVGLSEEENRLEWAIFIY